MHILVIGMQVIKAKSAETILADVTDFLAGQYFEDFNEATIWLLSIQFLLLQCRRNLHS
jgi:hypothetical protein